VTLPVTHKFLGRSQLGRKDFSLQTLLTPSEGGRLPALAISKIYFALGDHGRGFQWLSRSVEEHELTVDLKSEPLFDMVRGDPRFVALLRRMNLS
jgi:hypothetical protein